MSGVIAFGCGCQTGLLLGKRSHKLLLICRALALGQTRTMASRRNRRITHRPTSFTDDSTNHDAWDSIMSHLPKDKVATREQMLTSKEKDLFHPVIVAPKKTDGIDIGAELTGVEIEKHEMLKLLRDFYSQPKTQLLAAEHGLDMTIYKKSFDSFRHYCVETEQLPVDFHIVLSDIISGAGHVDDIFPYFLQHAHQVFPHLECIDELRNISDLTEPSNWYPTARKLERKIIYHVGPTNSGKTYHALQRFYTAKSGVYCGPLRMLAVEVFNKCNNEAETPCDLVTGEDRRQANPDKPAEHVACTVEMASLTNHYEVAIIDEIQMLRDSSRGWAWTKALLGLNADEIHVCGEGSAVDIVQEMVDMCGDEMEVRKYDRLTKLTILDKAVGTLKNIRPGDCIVCFGKNDIYSVTTQLESLGYQTAVIYGGLPPGTKYAQAEKFNDPNDSCSILVATDAIGMGLNLSIKRIIFFSLIKPTTDKDGSKQMEKITTSQALQIAGRAGRFGTQYEDGEVTTFRKEDLPMLKVILGGTVDPIEQVGLHPTAEQIELFAYHLPKATLSNLIDIFIHLCRLDYDKYFMCNMEDFKFLANIIEHIPLALRVRYTLCSAPISSQDTFTCNMFIKFARQYSTGLPITYDWLMEKMKAPFQPPKTLQDLVHLEQAFDVFDLYLWLGYRFTAMFPDMELVRESQTELDYVIQESVAAITALLKGAKTVKTKAPVIIATEKSYGRRLQLQPHKEKLKTKVHGAVTINEGSKATIQMENVVDSQLSDADSQISDRTASPVADLFSDSNPLYDDQETGHKGVETISHNETDIMKEIIDIRETKYKIDLPVVNRECEDIQKKKNIFSADKNKGEENVIDLIDDTIKDMDVVRESEDKKNAFSTVKGIRQQNETDLVGNRFRNMGVKESEKYIKRAFGRVYAINRGEGEDADINQPENTGIRDHLNSHFKKVKQHPFDFHFSKNIKQGNKSAFIKTEDIDTKNIRGRETLLYNKFGVRMPKRPRNNLMNLKNLFQSSESVTEKPAETGESLTVESQPGPMEEESLMSTLIKKGLITEEMMAQLHREWREAQERTHSNSDSDSDGDSVSNRKAEQRTLRNSDSDSDSVGNRKAKQRTSRNSDSDSNSVGNRKAKQRTYNNNDNVSDRDSVT